jgi:hypothetical protein
MWECGKVSETELTPFSSNAYPEWTIKSSAREEVHHVPTVQAEFSAQIERGWFIQFDLHLVPHYSCYREG